MDNLTMTESCGRAEEQIKMPSSAGSLQMSLSFLNFREPTQGPELPLSITLVPVPDKDAQLGVSKLKANVQLPTNEKAQIGMSELEVNVELPMNEKDLLQDLLLSNNFEMGDEECRIYKCEDSEESSVAGEGVAADSAIQTNQTNNRVDLHTETLTCHVCHQTSTSPSDLQAHTLTHSVESLFHCGECGTSFIEENDFINHKESHPGNAEFSQLFNEADLELCSLPREEDLDVSSPPEADWEFSDLLKLKRPSLPKEKNSERTFPDNVDIADSENCDDPSPVEETFPCDADGCGKIFRSMAALLAHDSNHSGEKTYTCDLCSWTFRHRNSLIGHLRRHTGEKPFQCTKCNKSFRAKHSLANHERSHANERRYKCTVCSKAYSHRTSLVEHMRTHTGPSGPFQCGVCKQAFACVTSLEAHQSLHSVENFRCDVCGNVYKKKTILVAHMKRAHTFESATKCSICGKTMKDKWNLTKHMKIHSRSAVEPHILAASLWSS